MLVQPFGFQTLTGNRGRLVQIGQYYQGGYIAYLQGSYPNQEGLIVAPTDATGSAVSWQEQTYSAVTTNSAYGQGATNTTNIITQSTTATVAATLCTDYSNAGYTDWFLPSQTELTYVRNNVLLLPNSGSFVGVGTTPAIVSLYWTSYSFAFNTAKCIDFGDTNTYVGNVTDTFRDGQTSPGPGRVRPCRYITPV